MTSSPNGPSPNPTKAPPPRRRRLPRKGRRRDALAHQGHPDRWRLGVHGRLRERLPGAQHPPLCPAAQITQTQRSCRTMQCRLAIRILRHRRSATSDRQNRRTRRGLPTPLQPSSAARRPRRPNPKRVSPYLPKPDDPIVSYVLPIGRWRGYHRSPHLRRCENWICKPSETRLRNHSRPPA